MIPKFIYENPQTTLNEVNETPEERLIQYRLKLYKDFYQKLESLKSQKEALIKNYLVTIKEIDLELEQKRRQKIYESQSLNKRR